MRFDYEDLTNIHRGGGRPSGGVFSTYSDICKTLQKYELASGKKQSENYINADAEALLVKLEALIDTFLTKERKGTLSDKKVSEIDAVGELREALVDLAPKRRLWKLLNSYSTVASHPHNGNCELIRNSIKGWIQLLSKGDYTLQLSDNEAINAEVINGNKLSIHAVNFFGTRHGIYERGDFFPIGVLVHEYHHHLIRKAHAGKSVYADEFVAHWKQYDAMGIIDPMGRQACVDSLNFWILDHGQGYRRRWEVSAESEIKAVFKGPEDTGAAYWDDHLDNAR